MRIKKVTQDNIVFDNGAKIYHDHQQDCCEHNYADFEQLDDEAMNFEFPDEQLLFKKIDGAGFSFGVAGRMFFVPCYSVQSGYYSSNIEIWFEDANGYSEKVFDFFAEMRDG